MHSIGVLTSLIACTHTGASDTAPASWSLPPFDELPSMPEPPDPFELLSTGEQIRDTTDWTERRAPELRALFAHYVYGEAPAPPEVSVTERAARAFGDARLVELDVDIGPVRAAVLLFVPAGAPAPVLLGLNKCGNHTVSADPDVPVPTSWRDPDCGDDATEAGRGAHAAAWPIDAALDAGWAVATVAQSDLDPDDPEDAARAGRLRDTFAPDVPAAHAWGTVAAWAWGLSRVIDALETRSELDLDRIHTFGHSRRGKTALWAAANDDRVAGVWAHQSGIVGAALNRGSTGETVAAINALFPHWFAPQFHAFAHAEDRLPVDQHLLLALVAPRRVVLTDGDEDAWANPSGAEEAADLARPVFTMFGAAPDALQWSLRPGGHEMRADDWAAIDAL